MIDSLKQIEGTVLQLQRMSTEDGPGIRTSVFMKGCSLNCLWCHNPESIDKKRELQWIGSRCIMCGTCIGFCKEEALSLTSRGVVIDRKKCKECLLCTVECPSTALEVIGEKMVPSALIEEILKDRVYFEKSGGGVTIGGGEPALQGLFVEDVLDRLKKEGIHTAIDTCGQASYKIYQRLLPLSDLVLFDLKIMDLKLHKKYTGHTNEKILENLKLIADFITHGNGSTRLWIRTPLIPGATDNSENIREIAAFITSHLSDVIERWELLQFNNLCTDKYLRFDKIWEYRKTPPQTEEQLEAIKQTAISTGIPERKIRITGGGKNI